MAGYVFFPIITFVVYSNPAVYANSVLELMKHDAPLNHEELDKLEQLKESIRRQKIEELVEQYDTRKK